MSGVGILATAHYLPERRMTAAEIGAASGIPEDVVVEKFGLRGKHIAADDEHVSDLAVAAGRSACSRSTRSIPPRSARSSTTARPGRTTPSGRSRRGSRTGSAATNAYAIEYDNVSMGTPVALRFARALLTAEPELGTVLLVAACRESYLLDYGNERSRFMFNFGDGAVAGLLAVDAERNLLLGSHAITDGSFSLQVKVPAGGSVEPASHATVDGRRHFLDVADPAQMKGGLDEVSLPNFVAAAEAALTRSGATLADVSYLCGIHMKRSMHEAIVEAARPAARACRLPRRHRSHERRRPAPRPRPGGAGGRGARRRPRPAPGRRYRLHVGGERRTLGPGALADETGDERHMSA